MVIACVNIRSDHVDASRSIRVTKCCANEIFYSHGFDNSCRNDSEQTVSWPPLSFYSQDLN